MVVEISVELQIHVIHLSDTWTVWIKSQLNRDVTVILCKWINKKRWFNRNFGALSLAMWLGRRSHARVARSGSNERASGNAAIVLLQQQGTKALRMCRDLVHPHASINEWLRTRFAVNQVTPASHIHANLSLASTSVFIVILPQVTQQLDPWVV